MPFFKRLARFFFILPYLSSEGNLVNLLSFCWLDKKLHLLSGSFSVFFYLCEGLVVLKKGIPVAIFASVERVVGNLSVDYFFFLFVFLRKCLWRFLFCQKIA